MNNPSRREALALILGALLSLPIAYLFLQTHGPFEQALDQLIWGLDHHDYSRWAIFPALLILPGLRAFHLMQKETYGKLGLWGFRLVFGGSVLAVMGQIWDYVLFDPWVHPMHGAGFMAQLLAILFLLTGYPIWAAGILRAKRLRDWQVVTPVLWMAYVVGLSIHIFTSDENWLYPRFGIDSGFIADGLLSLAFVLMGLSLLPKQEERSI